MAEDGDCVLFPGEILSNLKKSEPTSRVIVGPGLRNEAENIVVTKPGFLKYRKPNVYWIDCHQKRYVPCKGESVLGIVTNKAGDIYRVDIGSSEPASLSFLSFEGANKRNRPDVKVGDLVFGRLIVANKDLESELVCINSHGKSDGLGVIRDAGHVVHVSLNTVRKLLHPDCVAVKTLGKNIPFEISIGMNGRLWVKGRSLPETIALCNALSSVEYMNNKHIERMCARHVDMLSGF